MRETGLEGEFGRHSPIQELHPIRGDNIGGASKLYIKIWPGIDRIRCSCHPREDEGLDRESTATRDDEGGSSHVANNQVVEFAI